MTLIILAFIFTVFASIFMYTFFLKDDDITLHPFRKLSFMPTILFALLILFSSFTIIEPGSVGVKITLGKMAEKPLLPGINFVLPISDVEQIPVRLRKINLIHANAGTKDLQVVHTDIVVNYRLEASDVPGIYKNFGFDLEDKVILPSINESFKAVTAHYNSEELITQRDLVSKEIESQLQSRLSRYGIHINDISLVNFGFSIEYQNAIEQKVIATQSKLKAEQDLQRIKVEAQQAIARAQGEAEAIKIQSEAIQNNGGANYVQLKAIEKWNGTLPSTMLSDTQVPFINIKTAA